MKEEIEIVIRNGKPTKKCLREVLAAFDARAWLNELTGARGYVWSDFSGSNEKMEEIAQFFEERGVTVKQFRRADRSQLLRGTLTF